MKKTLLQIVQNILNDMDSDPVNSISDTVESEQVAQVVETVFYDLISTRNIPEHKELLKLDAASDTDFPTHFSMPENTKVIECLWYQDSNGDYREIKWKDPVEFLYLTDRVEGTDYDSVNDKNAGTTLRITNNQDPTFFTSFDDFWIVMNAYDSAVDTTLQASKVRAWGTVYPVFSQTDSYIPDIDATLHPRLIAEAKSTCMSLFKGGPDVKIEQTAKRHKSYQQNDMYRVQRANNWSAYGR